MPMLTADALVHALAAEFGNALAALAGTTSTPQPVTTGGHAGWIASLDCSGPLAGRITIGISDGDLRRACALVMGTPAEEVANEVALDTLRELTQQAAAAVAAASDARLTLTVRDVLAAGVAELEAQQAFAFALPDDFTPQLLVRADFAEPAVEGPPADVPAAAGQAKNLDVLLDIELPVAVRFGRTELPLLTLTRLGPGSVIDLHRSADEPVEVMVSGKVIARGEVVVVQGNYGVRITEIVSQADRIRSMGA
jgi:flagellar motor switch protein FliN/FliY